VAFVKSRATCTCSNNLSSCFARHRSADDAVSELRLRLPDGVSRRLCDTTPGEIFIAVLRSAPTVRVWDDSTLAPHGVARPRHVSDQR
jgi:hypothetical protein